MARKRNTTTAPAPATQPAPQTAPAADLPEDPLGGGLGGLSDLAAPAAEPAKEEQPAPASNQAEQPAPAIQPEPAQQATPAPANQQPNKQPAAKQPEPPKQATPAKEEKPAPAAEAPGPFSQLLPPEVYDDYDPESGKPVRMKRTLMECQTTGVRKWVREKVD